MRTVRRIYFYLVTLVSLEIALWGVVSLARNILSPTYRLQNSDLLASGLALVLVGLPIFLLHWWLAQRDAARDEDERASRVRGVFLYAALLATMIPVVQSVLAIVNRVLLNLFNDSRIAAIFGGQQTALDNLISIAVNAVVFVYFLRELRADWRANLPGSTLDEERRLYRTIWVIYGLLLLTAGLRLMLLYVLRGDTSSQLANGLALALVGAPVWVYNWLTWQRAAGQPEERRSILRLVVLYLLSLVGVVVTLFSAAEVINQIVESLLGLHPWRDLIRETAGALATLLPAAMVWAYYSGQLTTDLSAVSDEPRRAALKRAYAYILALIGNVTTFFGILGIVHYAIRQQFGRLLSGQVLEAGLANALTALIIGLPLWLAHWLRMQAEAARADELGDHARRSALRKGYLYLALFATVVGSMVTAGWLLYLVFQRLLGEPLPNFTLDALIWLAALLLSLVWLFYHLRALRADGQLAQRSLARHHAAFPVLILQTEDERFTVELVQALQRQTPRIPIAVHRLENGAPGDDLLSSKAVVLAGGQAVRPSDSLRAWLAEYKGECVLVPLPLDGWVWVDVSPRSLRDLAQDTAHTLRLLAEGQEVRPPQTASPWAIAAAVLGGIFGLILLAVVIIGVASGFN